MIQGPTPDRALAWLHSRTRTIPFYPEKLQGRSKAGDGGKVSGIGPPEPYTLNPKPQTPNPKPCRGVGGGLGV